MPRVTITYFYSPTAPSAIHLANEWVLTTVEDGYAEALAHGKLAFVSVNTDDPATKPVVDEYHARMPSLFITTGWDGVLNTVEVKALWLYLDESLKDEGIKNQFVSFLKKEIDKALRVYVPTTITPNVPLSSETTTETAKPTVPVSALLGVVVSMGSGAEYFDIAVFARDESGKLIPFSGRLTVKLWDRPDFFSEEKGMLLQQWEDIPVNDGDFVESVGVMFSLPYHDFMPASSSIGWTQVILSTGTGTIMSDVSPVQVRRVLGC